MAPTREKVKFDLAIAQQWLESLVWIVNKENSSLSISDDSLSFSPLSQKNKRNVLPEEKISQLNLSWAQLLQSHQCSIVNVCPDYSFYTSSLMEQITTRGCYSFLIKNMRRRSVEGQGQMLPMVVETLRKPAEGIALGTFNISHPEDRCHRMGLGAHLEGQWSWGAWSKKKKKQTSSNWKELMVRRVPAFQDQLKGHHLQVKSVNITTVAYLNRQGGTRSPQLMQIAPNLPLGRAKSLFSLPSNLEKIATA